MSKFKFTMNKKSLNQAMKKFKKDKEDQIRQAALHIGREIAMQASKSLIKRIAGSKGAWLKIYKDSIKYIEVEGELEWMVAGISDVELSQLPAEETVVEFNAGSNDPISSMMAKYNPWTIDAIPAISGGYIDDIVAKPASETEVSVIRSKLQGQMATILDDLEELNATVEKYGLTKFNGRIIADIDFMAKRLEYGLGGFERKPHWRPMLADVKSNHEKWLKSYYIQNKIKDAFDQNKLKDELPAFRKRFMEMSKTEAESIKKKAN